MTSLSLSDTRTWRLVEVDVELSRDYEPSAQRVSGVELGTRRLGEQWVPCAEQLYREGVRHVRIADPVTLCNSASVVDARVLVLIRELTGRGIFVDWTGSCDDGCARRFTHLHPPGRVVGSPDLVAVQWHDKFFPCKCTYRRGPGFIEIRDRRFGSLEMFTIDDPAYIGAIQAMIEGAPVADIAAEVRQDMIEAELVAEQAGHLWFLPVHVHRWPFPPMVV